MTSGLEGGEVRKAEAEGSGPAAADPGRWDTIPEE